MKLWFAVIDGVGNVDVRGVAAGTPREVLKAMLSVILAGQVEVEDVKNLYDEHRLDDKTVDEVLEFLVEADPQVHEDLMLCELDVDMVAFRERVTYLLNGQVGGDVHFLTEDVTFLFVKLGE